MIINIAFRQDENVDRRLYRYLQKAGTWAPRDRIMHWTGFPSPREHPLSAYVAFQCAVMRENRRLRPLGQRIVRSPMGTENYRLEALA
jgi:hypothetical protein